MRLRRADKMLKGHYTKAEHLGDVQIPGAHGICFRDANTLYVSRAIGHSKPTTGGVVTCSMDLEVKDLFSDHCSYYAIAAGTHGSLAVKNGTSKELEIYSQEPTKVLGIPLPTGKQKGIAVNGEGQVYICDAESDCVRVYESNGDLLKVIKNMDMKVPQYIALTQKGFVVTCMGDEPELLNIDEEGETNWSYDDLEFPSGVAVDDNGDIYVCDSEDSKVVMITRDGELSFDIVDEHMLKQENPFAVAVSGNKLAIQMQESDRVKLYRLTS